MNVSFLNVNLLFYPGHRNQIVQTDLINIKSTQQQVKSNQILYLTPMLVIEQLRSALFSEKQRRLQQWHPGKT